MTLPHLAELEFVPYIDARGEVAADLAGKLGLYAIYDISQTLVYIGYSRDLQKSLLQHLVRRPQQCHWFKAYLWDGDRPNRTQLDAIKTAWIEASGSIPSGNSAEEPLWIHPINVQTQLTPTEQTALNQADPPTQIQLLKNYARRLETEIQQQLGDRGLTLPLRFQPKLKEQGLLDLK